MVERTCGWCNEPIGHMQSRALYCCIQHKKNAGSKRFRERNPGYYKRYTNCPRQVEWKAKNAGRIRAYAREQQRQYRLDHPDHARDWFAANPEKHRLHQANRRARKLSNPGSLQVSERDWLRMVDIYQGRCAHCGVRPEQLHMDHVIPLKLGGRHAIGNIVPACQPCNSWKSARLLSYWKLTRLLTLFCEHLPEHPDGICGGDCIWSQAQNSPPPTSKLRTV